jgi:hypothetical protein
MLGGKGGRGRGAAARLRAHLEGEAGCKAAGKERVHVLGLLGFAEQLGTLADLCQPNLALLAMAQVDEP